MSSGRPGSIAAKVGADCLVLGSDFPTIPYPYAHQLDALARTGLGDDWLRAVCWQNAAALFDLPESPAPMSPATSPGRDTISGDGSSGEEAPA